MKTLPHTASFPLIMKLMHWTMALLLIAMIILGQVMHEMPLGATKLQLYGIHKSIGMILLALVVIRFMIAITSKKPAPLPNQPHWQLLAAKWTHRILYILMLGLPITGWLMSSASGFSVSVFGVITAPDLISKSKPIAEFLKESHEILGSLLIITLILHIGAALKHHFLDKDITLKRMMFRK